MTSSYQIIRSDRKTIGIHIMPDGSVVVRCPKRMRLDDIRRFVESKSDWIEKTWQVVTWLRRKSSRNRN